MWLLDGNVSVALTIDTHEFRRLPNKRRVNVSHIEGPVDLSPYWIS